MTTENSNGGFSLEEIAKQVIDIVNIQTRDRENIENILDTLDSLKENQIKTNSELIKSIERKFQTQQEVFAKKLVNIEEQLNENFTKDIETLKTELMAKIDELQNKLVEESSNSNNERQKISTRLDQEISKTNTNIETQIQQTKDYFQADIAKVDELIKQTNSDLDSNIKRHDESNQIFQENIETVNGQLKNLKDEFNNSLEMVKQELSLEITTKDEYHSKRAERRDLEFNEFKDENKQNFESIKSNNDILKKEITENFLKVDNKLDLHQSETKDQFNIANSQIENSQNQVEKLFSVIEEHAHTLEDLVELLSQLRKNYEQTMIEVKEDNKSLMAAFQKILTGTTESLRNEIIIISKEVRTTLDEYSSEGEKKFTIKSDFKQLQSQFKQLENDLRNLFINVRKQLKESLEESVNSFNSAIKESIDSVDIYRVELERYKDEIESMVERKVNEKYEFSTEILGNLVTKAEHLSYLIKESQINPVTSIAVPIPGIKNTNKIENGQNENNTESS